MPATSLLLPRITCSVLKRLQTLLDELVMDALRHQNANHTSSLVSTFSALIAALVSWKFALTVCAGQLTAALVSTLSALTAAPASMNVLLISLILANRNADVRRQSGV